MNSGDRMTVRSKTVSPPKRKAWSSRAKTIANSVSTRLFRRSIFSISVFESFGQPPAWQQALEKRWRSFWFDSNLPYALALLIVCATITVVWGVAEQTHFDDLWPEMGGMTFDVFFILIVFSLFDGRRERRQEVARQVETIDDYKRWDSEEARVRLAGAIRRLNRLGVFAVDLSGARLSGFSFRLQQIGNISGSSFYNGEWGNMLGDASVTLTEVDFGWINCDNVVFSPFDPLAGLSLSIERYARFRDCSFTSSTLCGATFDGASLKWSEVPPESHYEWEEDREGNVSPAQTSYGPFYETDVRGTSFKRCVFENADFRDAENVLEADFTGATGLDTALFDDDEIKAAILNAAGKA